MRPTIQFLDNRLKEQIIEQAIEGVPVHYVDSGQHNWWYEMADSVPGAQSSVTGSQPKLHGPIKEPAPGPHGELGATG